MAKVRVLEHVTIPSIAFGVDVQNYGDTADLIYMLDLDEVLDKENQDEVLITKHLGPGNYKIVKIEKRYYEQIVYLEKI
jgi:hypothetical protein